MNYFKFECSNFNDGKEIKATTTRIKMIEQTELIVSKWIYQPPVNSIEGAGQKLTSHISFDVMKKRTSTKKGIACRFTCEYVFEKETILEYVAEHSYVIDHADIIDKSELQKMIKNTYTMFNEKFDLRKLSTVLINQTLTPIDETMYELDPILLLLR